MSESRMKTIQCMEQLSNISIQLTIVKGTLELFEGVYLVAGFSKEKRFQPYVERYFSFVFSGF